MRGGERAPRWAAHRRMGRSLPQLILTLIRSTSCLAMRSKRVTRRRRTILLPPSTTRTRRWDTTVTRMEDHRQGLAVIRAVTRRWATKRHWVTIRRRQVQHRSLARRPVGETGATVQPRVELEQGREHEDTWSNAPPPARQTSCRLGSANRGRDVPGQQLLRSLAEG